MECRSKYSVANLGSIETQKRNSYLFFMIRYYNCANEIETTSGVCKHVTICVNNGTTTVDVARQYFVESHIITKSTVHQVIECLVRGEANVIAGDGFDTAANTVRQFNYSKPYETASSLFSRENFAIVTRQDDSQWSSFVFWVVTAALYAEEQSISQASANSMPLVNLFGSSFTSMLQHSIGAVGSYSDIYERNAASANYSRLPINSLNKSPFGPQHFPPAGLFGLL